MVDFLNDHDAIDALLEALGEPASLQEPGELSASGSWNFDDLEELMRVYSPEEEYDDIDVGAVDMDPEVDPNLKIDEKTSVNAKRDKRKATEALRLEKYGVEVESVSKRRFIYHFKGSTEVVTSYKAALRLCTAAAARHAAATTTTAPKGDALEDRPCD